MLHGDIMKTFTSVTDDDYHVIVDPDISATSPMHNNTLGRLVVSADVASGKAKEEVFRILEVDQVMQGNIADLVCLPLFAVHVETRETGSNSYYQVMPHSSVRRRQTEVVGELVGYLVASSLEVKAYFQEEQVGERLHERAVMQLRAEMMSINTYLAGDVYELEMTGPDGDVIERRSCIYELDEALSQAQEAIEQHRQMVQVPSMAM